MMITTSKLTLLLGALALGGTLFISSGKVTAARPSLRPITVERYEDLSFLSKQFGELHASQALPMKDFDEQLRKNAEIHATTTLPTGDSDLKSVNMDDFNLNAVTIQQVKDFK